MEQPALAAAGEDEGVDRPDLILRVEGTGQRPRSTAVETTAAHRLAVCGFGGDQGDVGTGTGRLCEPACEV